MQLSASQNPAPPPPVPFSPPSSSSAAANDATPRAQNRLSGEMRNRAPLPVPASGTPSAQNGHSRNLSGFDMAARSPPNQSSMGFPLKPQNFLSMATPFQTRNGRKRRKEGQKLIIWLRFRYQTRSLQVLSPGSLPGWSSLSVLTLYRCRHRLCAL